MVHERNVNQKRRHDEQQADEILGFGVFEYRCQEQDDGHNQHEYRNDDRHLYYIRKIKNEIMLETNRTFVPKMRHTDDTFFFLIFTTYFLRGRYRYDTAVQRSVPK